MRILSALCFFLFVGTAVAEEKPAFDASKLVGTWEYVSGVRSGEKVPAGRQR